MSNSARGQTPSVMDASARPTVVDRPSFQAELARLHERDKAHTRESDAIAATRRRQPMVEVDSTLPLVGPTGPVTLLDAFKNRTQLIAYNFMWHPGKPAAEQCEGCTMFTSQSASCPTCIPGTSPEPWEDSPTGWPRRAHAMRTDGGPPDWPPRVVWPGGRPTAQWPRLAAGHSDDLGTAGPATK